MKNRIGLCKSIVVTAGIVACGYLHPRIASAQEKMPSQINVQFGGLIPHDSTGNGITDHGTRTGELQANYSYQFSKWTGADAGFGLARYTQNYSGGFGTASVQSNLRDLQTDFQLHIPVHSARIHPYAVVGVGMFRFSPTSNVNNFAGVSSRTRAAGIYGGGSDFDISKRIGVRADYRWSRFKVPDFQLAALDLESEGHFAQPSVGVYYKFSSLSLHRKSQSKPRV